VSITPPRLFTPTHVITHKGCYDGFASAYAVWRNVGNKETVYLGGEYGKPIPTVPPQSRVIVADVSWSREEMIEFNDHCEQLLVLDHHKTAEQNLEGLDFAIFDMNRSGCGLTWDVLSMGEPRPKLIDSVEDRDIWKFEKEGTRRIHACLMSRPQEFEVWDEFNSALHTELGWSVAMSAGRCILDYRDQVVKNAAQKAKKMTIHGRLCLVINVGMRDYWSEIMHYMLDTNPGINIVGSFVVDFENDLVYWTLRSRPGGTDALDLATELGGGGHAVAAGATTDIGSFIHQGVNALPGMRGYPNDA